MTAPAPTTSPRPTRSAWMMTMICSTTREPTSQARLSSVTTPERYWNSGRAATSPTARAARQCHAGNRRRATSHITERAARPKTMDVSRTSRSSPVRAYTTAATR